MSSPAQELLSIANSNVKTTRDKIEYLENIANYFIKHAEPSDPRYRKAMKELNEAGDLYIKQCLLRGEASDHVKFVGRQLPLAQRKG